MNQLDNYQLAHIIQPASRELYRTDEKYMPSARVGHILVGGNLASVARWTVTGFLRVWIEWKPREEGGALAYHYGENPGMLRECGPQNESQRRRNAFPTSRGTELQQYEAYTFARGMAVMLSGAMAKQLGPLQVGSTYLFRTEPRKTLGCLWYCFQAQECR